MKHTILATAAGAEFDAFLYASIGEERDSEAPSVLSVLARHDVDPWDEAARLARLPLDAATLSLATVIAARRGNPAVRPDATATAARLIALLPRRVTNRLTPASADHLAVMGPNAHSLMRSMLLFIALMALMLVFQRLSAPPQPASGAAVPAAPTATDVPHPTAPGIQ
ncbi:MAG: hypothetical protein ABI580_12510 [Burkholderiaceae bacterium]